MGATFLGIDMGTSSIKLVLTDENNQVTATAARKYELSHPFEGWSQIDPQVWYESAMEAMEEIFTEADPSKLSAIGITGQMHTLVLLDEAGESLCPAIMWNDTRTAELVPEMKKAAASFPGCDVIERILSTGSPAADLYWMKKNEPELLAKCRKFLIGPDYLVYRLTGCAGTDYCEASTSSLYRIRERCWSEEMRNLIGLEREVYPQVCGAGTVAGYVLPQIAEHFGFSRRVAVITGTGDNPASAVATGCLGRGYPVISLGTSGVLMIPAASPDELRKGKAILFSTDGEQFCCLFQGAVQSTGDTVEWFTRKVLGENDLKRFDRDISIGDINPDGLLFYPHLSGEKTLYADPGLRGAFIGLRCNMDGAQMYYSIIEGLCFAFRELAEKMGVDLKAYGSVRVVGGGSSSRLWMQMLADVLQVPAQRVDGRAEAGFGAALLSRSAVEGMPVSHYTGETAQSGEIFVPDPARGEKLDKKYVKYLRIRDAMKYISEGRMPEASEDAADQ